MYSLAKTQEETCSLVCTRDSNELYQDDTLNIKIFNDRLLDIIEHVNSSFVFSINAPYGMGKSYALTRCWQHLKQHNQISIFYNAWQTDFYHDPFLAILSVLRKALVEYNKHSNSDFIQACVDGIDVVLNNIPAFGNIYQDIKTKIKEHNSTVSNQFESYGTAKLELRQRLEKLADNGNFRIVIFVDELDRCRPDYAVKTLEIIKHFFNIKHIVFVLAMDRQQIVRTVSRLYGDFDPEEYLSKFIDMDLYLPKPDAHNYVLSLCKQRLSDVIKPFFENTLQDPAAAPLPPRRPLIVGAFLNPILSQINYQAPHIERDRQINAGMNIVLQRMTNTIIALNILFNFSLRTQAKLVKFLRVFIGTLDTRYDLLIPELACLLTCFRFFDVNLLDSPNDMLNCLEQFNHPKLISKKILLSFPTKENHYWFDWKKETYQCIDDREATASWPPFKFWLTLLQEIKKGSNVQQFYYDHSPIWGDRICYENILMQRAIAGYERGFYPMKYLERIRSLSEMQSPNNKD